jgi:uncharacterized membrane protein SirB2
MFFQRGIWMLRGSPMIRVRWVKIVPHIVDTVLLASAVMLTLRIQQYPIRQPPGLPAKVLGLLVYIGLGIAAFRFAHHPWSPALRRGWRPASGVCLYRGCRAYPSAAAGGWMSAPTRCFVG